MGQDEVILDKRPVKRVRKKTTRKKKVSVKAKAQKEKNVEAETPEPVIDPSLPEAVTFFSRYADDHVYFVRSEYIPLGTGGKWVTKPARVLNFKNHFLVTADKEIIEYIRNPRGLVEMFDGYGRDVFEKGNPEHDEHIHRYSDVGQKEYLMELHMGGRKVAAAEKFSYEESV